MKGRGRFDSLTIPAKMSSIAIETSSRQKKLEYRQKVYKERSPQSSTREVGREILQAGIQSGLEAARKSDRQYEEGFIERRGGSLGSEYRERSAQNKKVLAVEVRTETRSRKTRTT